MKRTVRLVAVPALVAAVTVPVVSPAARERPSRTPQVTQLLSLPAGDELLLLATTYGHASAGFSWKAPGPGNVIRAASASAAAASGPAAGAHVTMLTASRKAADLRARSASTASPGVIRVKAPLPGVAGRRARNGVLVALLLPYAAARDAVDVAHLRRLPLPRLVRRALSKLVDASTGEIVRTEKR